MLAAALLDGAALGVELQFASIEIAGSLPPIFCVNGGGISRVLE